MIQISGYDQERDCLEWWKDTPKCSTSTN